MIGKILGNRYEIIEKVGGGGMAEVYKAKCKLLNRFVAVKILRDQFINDEEVMTKFGREAQAAASLSHPNIVNVYDVGSEGDIHYIVMEYIDGKTLKDYIREKGRLDTDEVLRISTDIAEALQAAHLNGIVHRDIKPHNIMMTKDNRVKVTDFGIARAATSSTITNTGSILGSAHYVSPEQARGGFIDRKSDIYSLGVVMYEMATGELPFQGDSPITVAIKHIQEDPKPPSEIVSSIPKGLESIILKAMMKDQTLRYANSAELLQDLNSFKARGVVSQRTEAVTDSRTQMLPAIDDEMISASAAAAAASGGEKSVRKSRKRDKKKKEKNNKKITIAAIILSLLLVSSVAIGYLYNSGIFSDRNIVVPNVVGMQEVEAIAELEEAGLRLNVRGYEPSSEYEEGEITRQDPEESESVRANSQVNVYISEGEAAETVEVPNLSSKSLEEAKSLIEESELILGDISYEYSDRARNTVLSQDPRSGAEIEKGTEISLVVSQGKEPREVSVPNLVGLTRDAAESRLTAAGLKIGTVSEEFSEKPAGTVLFQGTESGKTVQEGTAVNISVSKGLREPAPEDNDEDNADENDSEEDNGESDSADSVTKTVPFEVPLPQDKETAEVVVNKYQNGKKEEVYRNQVPTAQGKLNLEITATGSGTVKLEGIVDGTVVVSRDVQF